MARKRIPLGINGGFISRDEVTDTFPWYADGYPVIYYSKDGCVLCADCASDGDTSDPVQAADVYWEGPIESCEDCGVQIESAYGDPDVEEIAD